MRLDKMQASARRTGGGKMFSDRLAHLDPLPDDAKLFKFDIIWYNIT